MMMSSVSDETILPNAAPMITATARSRTLPRLMNALKSLSIAGPPAGRDCGRACERLTLRRHDLARECLMTDRRLSYLLAPIAALSLSACGINSIPTAEEGVKARWADVQNQYQRR